MKTFLRVLVVVAIVLVVLPPIVSACPLCKDAKSDADYAGGTASLPNGFYYSILFMVAAPFVVLGALVLRIVLARRRLRSAPGASSPASASAVPLLPDSRGAQP